MRNFLRFGHRFSFAGEHKYSKKLKKIELESYGRNGYHYGTETARARRLSRLQTRPSILASASVAGKKEGEGPLSKYYDEILTDDLYDEKTWEKAESKLQKSAIQRAIAKANIPTSAVDYVFAGDLLNQCAGSHYALKDTQIPILWPLWGLLYYGGKHLSRGNGN